MAINSTAPPGWKLTYEGGKRRAVNPQGENVSYNSYLNAQARRSGFKNYAEYRKYLSRISAYRKHKAARPNLALGSPKLGQFKRRVLDRKKPGDVKAHGPLARFLEDIGVRQKNAEYPVGDTPVKE